MDKKVSVIVNFHNGEQYLSECITSILNQSYQNLEIILWDNFSNDNSYNVIKSFNDKRIKPEILFYGNVVDMSWEECKQKYLGEVGR